MKIQTRYDLLPPLAPVFSPTLRQAGPPNRKTGQVPLEIAKPVSPSPVRKARPNGVSPYDQVESAALWKPSIETADCLVLGYPWGSWNFEGDAKETLSELPEIEDYVAGDGPDIEADLFLGLLSSPALSDPVIWDWASRANRTLIWVLPPVPTWPREGPFEAKVEYLGLSYFLRALGGRISVLRDPLPAKPLAKKTSKDQARWEGLAGPLAGEARLLLRPDPPGAGSLARGTPKHLKSAIAGFDRLCILDPSPESHHVGTVIAGECGEGRVVFMLARHPEDAAGLPRLLELARVVCREAKGQTHKERKSEQAGAAEPAAATEDGKAVQPRNWVPLKGGTWRFGNGTRSRAAIEIAIVGGGCVEVQLGRRVANYLETLYRVKGECAFAEDFARELGKDYVADFYKLDQLRKWAKIRLNEQGLKAGWFDKHVVADHFIQENAGADGSETLRHRGWKLDV